MLRRNSLPLIIGVGIFACLSSGCGKRPEPQAQSVSVETKPTHKNEHSSKHKHEHQPPAATSPRGSNTLSQALRLVSWNLEWLNAEEGSGPTKRSRRDYDRLAEYVGRIGAQVFAVQEVDGEEAVARVFDPERYDFFIANQALLQRVGFVIEKGITVTRHPDLSALDVGGVRAGVDVTLTIAGHHIRLLVVHLKSGCFNGSLDQSAACQKLAKQVPPLEAWIDARAREGAHFAVVGDFNRHLFREKPEAVWSDLDDGDPQGLKLWSPTEGMSSRCRDSKYPHFVDHLVLSAPLKSMMAPGTFIEHIFDPKDGSFILSDHCPISIDFAGELSLPMQRVSPRPAPSDLPPPAASGTALPLPASGSTQIKGNISSSGKKLYHLPHCPGYKSTRIDLNKGEQFFATAAEAEAAGWVKAGNCR
jgi:endonuclease/exonuclease/phosphatase family metal-dependent hydrolase